MIDRFEGDAGRQNRVEAMQVQRLVGGNKELATELADAVTMKDVQPGQTIITQDGDDTEVYFIVSGNFEAFVNGRKVSNRSAGDCVGEMVAIEPAQRRSATVTASVRSLIAQISEGDFNAIASRHPDMYRNIARELARRLLQRNATVGAFREQTRVFIISSKEALPVARIVQNALSPDFLVVPWSDDVFKVSSYALESIEAELDRCDFAIAIAHADDISESRGKSWPAPRDNVIFELGLFMGRLNRQRAILMEPREDKVKLPSDLTGC